MTAITSDAVEHKRATVRPDKGDAVAELTASFSSAQAALLTEYRGLTVKQLKELRTALGADTTYSVVKNTLTKIAAGNAGLEGLDDLLAGPTAVAFVTGDPVHAAKALRDFAKAHPALVVKGGVMDGKAFTADEIKKLADLESREVLLAKLAGAMKASLTQAVYLFAAPLAQAARAVGALEAKAQQDPSILAGGAGAPAAAEPADEPADEPAPEDTTEAPVAEADSTADSTPESTDSD
ncbi:MAG: large subunit ribosomal protein [Frankiales bacterium]|jgi:large subunit ribosomal protein L10|nr:large subunit ribosomal protein [Frankiales bacterium]